MVVALIVEIVQIVKIFDKASILEIESVLIPLFV